MRTRHLSSSTLVAFLAVFAVSCGGGGGDEEITSGDGSKSACSAEIPCQNEDETCNFDTGFCEVAAVDLCAGVICPTESQCNQATGFCEASVQNPPACDPTVADCGGGGGITPPDLCDESDCAEGQHCDVALNECVADDDTTGDDSDDDGDSGAAGTSRLSIPNCDSLKLTTSERLLCRIAQGPSTSTALPGASDSGKGEDAIVSDVIDYLKVEFRVLEESINPYYLQLCEAETRCVSLSILHGADAIDEGSFRQRFNISALDIHLSDIRYVKIGMGGHGNEDDGALMNVKVSVRFHGSSSYETIFNEEDVLYYTFTPSSSQFIELE